MESSFEVIIRQEVNISTDAGSVHLAPGYILTIGRDDVGDLDGARLSRIDADGTPTIRLTQTEYEVLDGTRFLSGGDAFTGYRAACVGDASFFAGCATAARRWSAAFSPLAHSYARLAAFL
jgi:hypothetical protein